MTAHTTVQTLPPSLQPLTTWLVKDGASLGLLSEPQRALALGLAWAGLPAGVMSEPEVNAALKRSLAGASRWLDIDHVELRRWLVDAGWLARDGYGREYRRVAAESLPGHLQALAHDFAGIDGNALAADLRAAHDARRLARRQAWDARDGVVR